MFIGLSQGLGIRQQQTIRGELLQECLMLFLAGHQEQLTEETVREIWRCAKLLSHEYQYDRWDSVERAFAVVMRRTPGPRYKCLQLLVPPTEEQLREGYRREDGVWVCPPGGSALPFDY